MLAGDIILGVRVRINDLPRTLAAPSIPITAAVQAVIGGSLPAGTYYLKQTFTNGWGETISGPEAGPFVIPSPASGIVITAPDIATVPGATGLKFYFGSNGPGTENQWLACPSILAAGGSFSIQSLGLPGVPPTRNTSFYPDIDGQRVSAYTIYQWLNKALDLASTIANGIPDMTALNTILNQTMYEIIGQWAHFDHGWWNGYIITLGGRDILFYRNVVPGVVATGVLQQISNRIIIELQPQPNYGGALTTCGPVGISDTSITVASTAGFLLPFGMAILGTPGSPTNPSACEVISFSTISGNVLGGVVRGMGGTVQQAWPALTTVAEGNLRLAGRRSFVAPNYAPGNSYSTLSVPAGWSQALEDFMVSRYREAEGNVQEANRLFQSFTNLIKTNLNGNKLVAGPRQVGFPGSGSLDTYPARGLGGNLIIP